MRSFSEQCQGDGGQNVRKLHFCAISAAFRAIRTRQTLSRQKADFWYAPPGVRAISTAFAPIASGMCVAPQASMPHTATLARLADARTAGTARSLRDVSAPPVRTPRIVAIGGGTGLPSVLEGLSALAAEDGATGPDHVSAIVTVTDEGGSSGRLRREFGMLPPGDIRNCLAALAGPSSPFR